MTLERAKEICPKFFEKLQNEVFSDRELIVLDHNYEEMDGEEPGELNPHEYNYYLYIPEPSLDTIGKAGLEHFITMTKEHEAIEAFIVVEEDLFGVRSDLDEEELLEILFLILEESAQ